MRKLIAVLLMSIALIMSASPAHATALAPGCPTPGFCLHPSPTDNPIFFASAGVTRNTCLATVPDDVTSFITNNTGTQWWAFHKNDCIGTKYIIHAGLNVDLRNDPTWDKSIRAVMRTALQS